MAKVEVIGDNVEETDVVINNENPAVVEESNEVDEAVSKDESEEEVTTESNEESEEIIVTFGDDEPDEEKKQDSSVIRAIRKRNRELEKELKKLKKTKDEKNPSLGEKPTIEGCDYDSEVYEKALVKWYDDKRVYDQQEAEKVKTQESQAQEWQNRLDNYNNQKAELSVNDYEDIEDDVREKLSETQQGIIVSASSNAARFVYALGKNAKKLDELSNIKDPIQFAVEVGKLEASMKYGTKTKAKPEKMVRNSGGIGGSLDSSLDKLRAKAIKRGDFTEYHKAKRSQRKK